MRPRSPRPVSLAFFLFFAAAFPLACNPWEEVAQPDQLVWSDDDSELAIQELRFEQRQGDPLSGTTDKQNFRHQLFRSDTDGERRSPVGREREGQNGAELFFMKSAGYLVASLVNDDDGSISYERVALDDGDARAIPLPDDSHDYAFAIPSPDGGLIAVVSGAGQSIRVTLLDEATLAPARERADVTVTGSPDWTWRPDGAFVVTNGEAAWALTLEGEGFSDTNVPGCTNPKTSSSMSSSEGVILTTSPEGAVEMSDPDPALAFGCQ